MNDSVLLEYEKLVGKPTKWTLFPENEKEYETFRLSIIDSPYCAYDKKKLPFTDIKVYNYDLYLLKKYCDIKKKEGKELFYIKDDTPGLSLVLAFGYFDESNSAFNLLANSLIRKTDFSDKIMQIPSMHNSKIKFNGRITVRKENINDTISQDNFGQLYFFRSQGYRITADIPCSASLAASYVLGEKADYNRWKGLSGKSLAETYNYYKNNLKELVFIKMVWNDAANIKLEPKGEEAYNASLLYDKIIAPLLHYKKQQKNLNICQNQEAKCFIHCFLIDNNKNPQYYAEGFYNPQDHSLNVMAGAELANDVVSSMLYSSEDMQRRNFIRDKCMIRKSKNVLKRDHAFDMIDTATFFITGQDINGLKAWKTSDGKSLMFFI